MQNQTKLRRIGNSLGTTFSKGVLQQAGLTGDEPLELVVRPGELRLRRAMACIAVEFTPAEATALAAGETATKAARAAQAKVRKLLQPERSAGA